MSSLASRSSSRTSAAPQANVLDTPIVPPIGVVDTHGVPAVDDFLSGDEEGASHDGAMPMLCTFPGCHKEFGSRWSLKRHLCTHTGEKSFECAKCGKEFVQKCSLRRHEQTHTQSKAWVCTHPHCGKQFKLKEYLDVHKRTHMKTEIIQSDNLINVGIAARNAQQQQQTQNGLSDQLRKRLVRMSLRHRKEIAASNARYNACNEKLKEYEIGFLEAMTLITALAPDGRPSHLVQLLDRTDGGSSSSSSSSSSYVTGEQGEPPYKRARSESSPSSAFVLGHIE